MFNAFGLFPPYCFFRRRLAVPNSPRMASFVEALKNMDTPEGQEAWRQFLFNVDKLKELGSLETEVASAVLAAGTTWQGAGWNSTTASRALYDKVGLGLVTADFGQYLGCWLYTCALYWKVDVPSANLSPEAANAAFSLYSMLVGDWGDDMQEDDQGDDEEEPVFSWEQQGSPLPAALASIWKK